MTALWKLPATEVSRLVMERSVLAVEVTRDVLERIDAVNPKINAVVDQFADEALAAAAEIDSRIANGNTPGPLAGVPVTIKVNVDQKGRATTNGLRIQKDLIAESDSPVVRNLKKAGAVVVGRTNTPAFSLRWFTRNSLHGHTLNPRDKKLTPGGSSGGAAACVASGIGAIGHGTDIAGSIRYPAYACGVHGLRPSPGTIPAVNQSSADRHIGAQLMAVSGPIARTIEDIEVAFAAMCVQDLRDPWWTPLPAVLPEFCKKAALTIAPDNMTVALEVEAALRDAGERLSDAGWEVVELDCPTFRRPAELQAILWLAEFRRTGGEALVREGDQDAQFVYSQMELLCPVPDLEGLMDALQERVGLMRTWRLFLQQYPILICPVSGELPFPDLLDVQSPEAFRRVIESQLTQIGLPLLGLPGLTVSTGMAGTAPVGVQLVADRYREDILTEAGKCIEARGAPASPIEPQW